MEDHLLEIFGGHDTKEILSAGLSVDSEELKITWNLESQAELTKIPGFIRGKIKRNTEKFAQEQKMDLITLEVMYAAKEAAS